MSTKLPYINDVACRNCIHRQGINCAAFPEGIPYRFFSGVEAHDEPVEGDNGIQFEPITKEYKQAQLGITLKKVV